MFFALNRTFINQNDPAPHLLNRGLMVGDGVFTTLYAHHEVCDLDLHCARLRRDVETFGLHFDPAGLEQAINTLLQKNALTHKPARVRITLTRGQGKAGLGLTGDEHPLEIITTALLGDDFVRHNPAPLRVMVSDLSRGVPSILTRTKHVGYQVSQLALKQAKDLGYDDALLLDSKGHVACGTTATFYFYRQGVWYTPPLTDGALPGIVRQKLLERGGVSECPLQGTDLSTLESAAFSNSIQGIRPICMIQDYALPDTLSAIQKILP